MFSETISFLNVSTRRFLSTLLRQEWLLCAVVIYHWTKTMRLWLGWNRWDALGLIGVKMWFNLCLVRLVFRDLIQWVFKPRFVSKMPSKLSELDNRLKCLNATFMFSINLLNLFALLWFELWVDTELCLLQRRPLRSRRCVRISSKLVVWSCAVRRVHKEFLVVSCSGMKMRKSQRARHIIFREIDIPRHL